MGDNNDGFDDIFDDNGKYVHYSSLYGADDLDSGSGLSDTDGRIIGLISLIVGVILLIGLVMQGD